MRLIGTLLLFVYQPLFQVIPNSDEASIIGLLGLELSMFSDHTVFDESLIKVSKSTVLL